MNILHIMKDYKPNTGGSVVRNGNMIDHYKGCFDDQICIIDLDGDKFPKESIEDGVLVMRCKSIKEMIQKAISTIRKRKIDVIQVHNFRFLFVGYIAKQITKRKIKISAELHAIYRMSSGKEKLAYWLLKRVDLISVLSESAKNYLVQEKGISKDRILVLRNGVKESIGQKEESQLKSQLKELSKKYCIIAYTGSFIDWQGVRFLADHFDDLARSFPNLFLVMLGDGPDFEYVKNTINNSSFKERAVVRQSVGSAVLSGIMDEVDVVLIPREKNLCTNTAVPLKAIEAMQMGKCILASNDNGLTELLNNDNARIFEAYNIDSLKRQLESVICNPELRIILGEQAKIDAKNKLRTWDMNVVDLHDAYMRICNT